MVPPSTMVSGDVSGPWRPPAPRQRAAARFVLVLAGLVSAAGVSALPADGPHPLALVCCLLPLPLALLAGRIRGGS
ncbi:MAG: hypothetical protein ACK5UG_05335 [Synechococcaceae cyanobacterium]